MTLSRQLTLYFIPMGTGVQGNGQKDKDKKTIKIKRKKYSNDPLKATLPHFIPMGTGGRGIVQKAINRVLAISQNLKSQILCAHFESDFVQEVLIEFVAEQIRLIPRGCLCFGFL